MPSDDDPGPTRPAASAPSADGPPDTPDGHRLSDTIKVLALFVAVVLVEATAVLGVNYAVDPYGRFGSDLLAPLSLEDPTLLNVVNLKVYQYDTLASRPALVIVGSSRSETLDPREFAVRGHPQGYNFALPAAAAPENVVAVFRYLVQTGAPPQELYYGIEWTHFQDRSTPMDQVWSSPELGPHLAGLWPSHMSLAGKVQEAFSLDYLNDALRWIAYHTFLEPFSPWYFDTLGVYHDREQERRFLAGELDALDEVRKRWEDARPESADPIRPYSPPGPAKTAVIDLLVRLAREQGTNVTFFFTPIHPVLLDALRERGFEAGHAAELEVLRVHCGGGVRVFDFTDIRSFGGDARYFTGPTHYLAPNATLIVEALHRGEGDLCPAPQATDGDLV